MKKYIQLTKMFIEEEFQSGVGLLINFALSSLGIIALLFLWRAIYGSRDEVYGISQEEMIRYYLGVLVIGRLIKSGADDYFKEKIESGDIVSDFTKPVNYILLLFARTVAKIIVYFFGFLIICLVLSLLLHTTPFINVTSLFYSIIPIIFAFLLGFIITTIISSLYFYFPDLRYFAFLARDIIIGMLAGVMFNLELLTGNIYKLFSILPFKYIINFPVLIFTSDVATKNIFHGVITQLIWILVLGTFCIYLFKSGYKRYTTYGG